MIVEEFLQRKYFEELKAQGLNVYSSGAIPENEDQPFVVIGELQSIQRLNPCESYECFVTIDVVTRSLSPIGRGIVFALASQCDVAVRNIGQYSDGEFRLYNTYLSNSFPLEERTGTHYYFRNIRTYSHLVSRVATP